MLSSCTQWFPEKTSIQRVDGCEITWQVTSTPWQVRIPCLKIRWFFMQRVHFWKKPTNMFSCGGEKNDKHVPSEGWFAMCVFPWLITSHHYLSWHRKSTSGPKPCIDWMRGILASLAPPKNEVETENDDFIAFRNQPFIFGSCTRIHRTWIH